MAPRRPSASPLLQRPRADASRPSRCTLAPPCHCCKEFDLLSPAGGGAVASTAALIEFLFVEVERLGNEGGRWCNPLDMGVSIFLSVPCKIVHFLIIKKLLLA